MTPPLRARLHQYRLTVAEFALLTAMCEHRSDGSAVWASVTRLAAYSKLSERTVQALLRRFCARGILSQRAPGNAAKQRPATYRINEAALEEDPRMAPYRSTGQEQLPGIQIPAVPGEVIPDLVQPLHQGYSEDTLVQPLHQAGAAAAPNSRLILENHPPFQNLPTKSEAKAFRPVSSVEKRYSPEIGDAIDYRNLCKARDDLNLRLSHGWGSELSEKQLYELQCVKARLMVSRALELERRATEWPEGSAPEGSA